MVLVRRLGVGITTCLAYNRSDESSLLCSHAAFTPSSSSQHLKIQTSQDPYMPLIEAGKPPLLGQDRPILVYSAYLGCIGMLVAVVFTFFFLDISFP